MEANCGPAPGAFISGVGRQAPIAAVEPTIPSTPRNGGGAGAIPSVRRQAQMASATRCPQATPLLIDAPVSCGPRAARDVLRCAVSVALWPEKKEAGRKTTSSASLSSTSLQRSKARLRGVSARPLRGTSDVCPSAHPMCPVRASSERYSHFRVQSTGQWASILVHRPGSGRSARTCSGFHSGR